MKQNNKFNRFGRGTGPEKYSSCSCGGKSKLHSRKNYPFGKNSKPIISEYYKCEKCGKIKFIETSQKGGKRR